MIEKILHERITENTDWVTLLFVLSFAIIALTKSIFENRFNEFMQLLFSNKYIKIYRDGSHLKSGFILFLFLVQIISIALFIQLSLTVFGYGSKTDWVLFIQITTGLLFFILSKFLIEKIVAVAFEIEEFVDQFNVLKVSYRTYIGLFLLPIDIILFYYTSISRNILLVIIAIVLISNTITYLISIKNYQKLIFGKLFYFILYLCTFEIAPYYFVYFLFTK